MSRRGNLVDVREVVDGGPTAPSGVVWEARDVTSGEVVGGRRVVAAGDVEVSLRPPPPRPRLRSGLRRAVAEGVPWLVSRGRTTTAKRLRLGAGFWLVLREQPRRTRPAGVALQAERDGAATTCWEWFPLDDARTATQLGGSGRLHLEWAANRDGNLEVVGTTVSADVTFSLLPRSASARTPRWVVRLDAGSTVRWPQAGDGIRLVPRLMPRPAPAPAQDGPEDSPPPDGAWT